MYFLIQSISLNPSDTMATPVKIAIIGPQKSGKTKVANIITGNYTAENVTYDPTVGVRILPHIHEHEVR
jgi:ABC-type branched-subunit amino acid transport system ATPase component